MPKDTAVYDKFLNQLAKMIKTELPGPTEFQEGYRTATLELGTWLLREMVNDIKTEVTNK